MFSKKNNNSHRENDRIWADGEHKYQGIVKHLKEVCPDSVAVFVAAHFKKTLESVITEVSNAGMGYNGIEPKITDAYSNIFILLKEDITNPLKEGQFPFEKFNGKKVFIISAEHHPLKSEDDELINFIQKLDDYKFCFHFSLDDPLITRFGGERVSKMMEMLGIQKEEVISHPMIDKSLENAQKKIAEKAKSNNKAVSGEEWFVLNYD